MKAKRLLVLTLMALCATSAWAYDFSAVSPSGHTLYYNIVDGHAEVVQPGTVSIYNDYVTGDLVIPAAVFYNGTNYVVTSLSVGTFYYCNGLTSVTIPSSVTSIGNNAFRGCSSLSSVTIPSSVTSIDFEAFCGCSGLTSVTIPSSVTSIGYGAFSGCSGLTTTVYTGTIAQWCSITFNLLESNPLYYSHSLIIDGAEITNLVIPEGVTSISSDAFAGCSRLTSVTIPSSVTSIGYGAFYNCSGLTSVTIPSSVTSIGSEAFYGCSGLTSVTIPSSVTSIGGWVFSGCSSLASVTIPSSVTSIGYEAFYNVRHIEYYGSATGSPWGAISMNGVTDGDFVFSDATQHYLLAYIGAGGDVTIPSTVDTIGPKAFYRCSGLTSVTIPSSITSIGSDAFSYCSGLTEITVLSSIAPSLGSNAFSGINTTIPINIPCGGSMSYYSRWSYFSNFVEDPAFQFEVASADETMGSVSVLTQPTCSAPTAVFNAIPNSGYRFDHWSDGNTENPRSLIVTSDTNIAAYFAAAASDTVYIYVHDTVYIHDTIYITSEGIGDVEAISAKIYQRDGQIVVEGANGNTVVFYDVNGRMLATKRDEYAPLRFDAPVSGTYMIKIGNHPARKMVVVR